MSCISSSIKIIASVMASSITHIGADIGVGIEVQNDFHASVDVVGDRVCSKISITDKATLNVSATQICTIHKAEKYIKVDKDVLWVTPDVWEQIMVQSNTDWEIV